MWFFYVFSIFIVWWMLYAPAFHLDTSPQYPVMLYWVNLYQAIMMIVLGVGQQVLSRGQEKRQEHEAKVIDGMEAMMEKLLSLEERIK